MLKLPTINGIDSIDFNTPQKNIVIYVKHEGSLPEVLEALDSIPELLLCDYDIFVGLTLDEARRGVPAAGAFRLIRKKPVNYRLKMKRKRAYQKRKSKIQQYMKRYRGTSRYKQWAKHYQQAKKKYGKQKSRGYKIGLPRRVKR